MADTEIAVFHEYQIQNRKIRPAVFSPKQRLLSANNKPHPVVTFGRHIHEKDVVHSGLGHNAADGIHKHNNQYDNRRKKDCHIEDGDKNRITDTNLNETFSAEEIIAVFQGYNYPDGNGNGFASVRGFFHKTEFFRLGNPFKVMGMINDIETPITLKCKDAINNALAAYNALSDDAKAFQDNGYEVATTGDRLLYLDDVMITQAIMRIVFMFMVVVSIVLARLISPDEFGLVSLVMIFINICNVFVTSGLGSGLIQKKEVPIL